MPKISIVIPVYNTELYLKKCLDSLIKQTFQDIEIICVDDGSTDNSFTILKQYKKEYKEIVIIQTQNKGAAIARNIGLHKAKGEYIIFLDSDDTFDKDLLSKLYDTAITYNSDMVVCSAQKIDENDKIIENPNPLWPLNIDKIPIQKPFNWSDFPDEIFGLFCVVPWIKLYNRKMLINKNVKFQNLTSSNDLYFGEITKIIAKRIVAIDNVLVNYRQARSGNISSKRAQNTINIVRACLQVKNYLLKKNIYSQLEKAYINATKNHLRSGISLCKDNEYENFIEIFKAKYPTEFEFYKNVLIKDKITNQYISQIIGTKKVYMWGASLFIKQILEKENTRNSNILGIIDRNQSLWGKTCGNYEIFSPEIISKTKPDAILLTVFSKNEEIYKSLKIELEEKYPDIELLKNIFN